MFQMCSGTEHVRKPYKEAIDDIVTNGWNDMPSAYYDSPEEQLTREKLAKVVRSDMAFRCCGIMPESENLQRQNDAMEDGNGVAPPSRRWIPYAVRLDVENGGSTDGSESSRMVLWISRRTSDWPEPEQEASWAPPTSTTPLPLSTARASIVLEPSCRL